MTKARGAIVTDKPVRARLTWQIVGPITEGSPTSKVWRADDVIDLLVDAFLASDVEQRRKLQDQATLTAYFVFLNKKRFKARDDRRGRPSGPGAKTAALIKAAQARMTKGKKQRTALREELRAEGVKGEIKGRVDHAARQMKPRRK